MALGAFLVKIIFLCAASATPATMNFNNALQQQSLHTVLLSIEERLRNLDEIYSMQFSPTIESKIEVYAKKLESLDSKIQRMEAIMSLNLDKISENISTKNFKDDIFKTNTFRKLDSTYEGITHRMGYIERKLDTHVNKLYNKIDGVLSKLDKMEETAAARNTDLEVEMADTIAAVDDVKTTCNNLQENIFNTSQKHIETVTKIGAFITKHILDTKETVEKSHKNITGIVNPMQNFSAEINDYANKIVDMYNDVLNNNKKLDDLIQLTLKDINSSRTENQKNHRNLMVQLGKLQTKEAGELLGDGQKLTEISKKIDVNFEKMFLSQDLFLESCHRVQLDESQIESKISVILEKLMDTFEKKISNEVTDTKKYENLLKIHDSNVKSNLHQVGSNINRLYKKINNDNEKFEEKADTLGNALYVLIEDKIDANESNAQILEVLKKLSVQIERLNVEIVNVTNKKKQIIDNTTLDTKTDSTEKKFLVNTTNSTMLTNQTDDTELYDPFMVDFSTRIDYENFQEDENVSDNTEFTTEETLNEDVDVTNENFSQASGY